jgi:hypothetical protein
MSLTARIFDCGGTVGTVCRFRVRCAVRQRLGAPALTLSAPRKCCHDGEGLSPWERDAVRGGNAASRRPAKGSAITDCKHQFAASYSRLLL